MKLFNHKRPVRDGSGLVLEMRPAPVWRKTALNELGSHHGSDRGRKLAVGLLDGDIIALRPAGTRREPLTIQPSDLYDYLVRCVTNRGTLEKARARKSAKAQRLANARQARAEKRLFNTLEAK